MREHPILFSAPIVRAILDGSKTQTRRVVKGIDHARARLVGLPRLAPEYVFEDPEHRAVLCPYGAVGDRLWVREAWQPIWAEDEPPPSLKSPEGWRIGYPATDGVQEYHDEDRGLTTRCKPGIHMYRWMSRIDLEITHVRVERLQAISDRDTVLEGLDPLIDTQWGFRTLWNEINGAESWDANPWVWVVRFRRVRP